jgi:hypothetical protein
VSKLSPVEEDAMADINTALAESRAAVDQMLSAAERSGSAWATPRAPGKWSPSQIVEHVARALEESANAADYARFQAMHTLHHTKQIGQS